MSMIEGQVQCLVTALMYFASAMTTPLQTLPSIPYSEPLNVKLRLLRPVNYPNVTLFCEAKEIDPHHTLYTFFLNDVGVQTEQGSSKGYLYTTVITSLTSGSYQCSVSSDTGKSGYSNFLRIGTRTDNKLPDEVTAADGVRSSSVALGSVVTTTPRITLSSTDLPNIEVKIVPRAIYDRALSLECVSEDVDPDLSYFIFYHNNTVVQEGAGAQGLDKFIFDVNGDTIGKYKCAVQSQNGPTGMSDTISITSDLMRTTPTTPLPHTGTAVSSFPDVTMTTLHSSNTLTTAEILHFEDDELFQEPFQHYLNAIPDMVNVSLYISRPINPKNLTLICDSNYKSTENVFTFYRNNRVIQEGYEKDGLHMHTFVLREDTMGVFQCTVNSGNGIYSSNILRINFRRRPGIRRQATQPSRRTTISRRNTGRTTSGPSPPASYLSPKRSNRIPNPPSHQTLTTNNDRVYPTPTELSFAPVAATVIGPRRSSEQDGKTTTMVLRTAESTRVSNSVQHLPEKTDLKLEQDQNTVLLTCVVDPELPFVAWYRNGEPFFNPADRHQQIQFEITQFTAGAYQCKAFKNPQAVLVSNVVTINPPDSIPPFLADDPDVIRLEMVKYKLTDEFNNTKTEVLLGCHNSRLTDTPVFRFFRNGKLLRTAPNAPWIRFDLTYERVGIYKCESKDRRDSSWSDSNVVHV